MTKRTAPSSSTASARTTPLATISLPATGSAMVFSNSNTWSRVAATLFPRLDLACHFMGHAQLFDRDLGFYLIGFAADLGIAQRLFDGLLRCDAHLFQEFAHRHVEIFGHWRSFQNG